MAGEFEVESFNDEEVIVSIDGYDFAFGLIASHKIAYPSVINRSLINYNFTSEQKEVIYKHIEPGYNKYITEQLIAKKERELEIIKQTL